MTFHVIIWLATKSENDVVGELAMFKVRVLRQRIIHDLAKCGALHVDSITYSLTHFVILKADISLNIDVKTLQSNLNHLWALYQRFMNSILYYLIS